jgi:hypothetical protein
VAWEVDWAHPDNTGSKVWARNPESHIPACRDWRMVTTGYLRSVGIQTPTRRADAWEVDWSKRNGKLVWGRNPHSKIPSAREWHWVDFHTLKDAGVSWQPRRKRPGRFVGHDGYVMLTPGGMTDEEVAIADEHGLWSGKKRTAVREHRLVAVKKFGRIPRGSYVRHLNGAKTDNRPENLVLGTTKENVRDHETARRVAMFWRNKYHALCEEIGRIPDELPDAETLNLFESQDT